MKRIFYLFPLALALLFTSGCKEPDSIAFSIENPINILRADEAITFTRAQLEDWHGPLPDNRIPILINETGDTIPSQADDLDKNGRWDELFFLCTLEPSETKGYEIHFVDPSDVPGFTRRSNIRFGRITETGPREEIITEVRPSISPENHGETGLLYQFEGPGWENDKVGFRNYFDERNGMDIFGKTTSEMVLDNVGIDEDYHVMQEWGMDNLKVGSSLGAGSLALVKDGELHRVAVPSDGRYELIVDGPLRSVFRLIYENWMVDNETYDVIHEITIHGGAWFYESSVQVTGPATAKIVAAGITTLDLLNDTPVFDNSFENHLFLATHDTQGYEGEYLGMALLTSKDQYRGRGEVGETEEDIDFTTWLEMDATTEPVHFRFYACWERSDEAFIDKGNFLLLLGEEAYKLDNPVKVLPY